jgi:hypothetical protein
MSDRSKQFNHLFTIAFSVISSDPEGATERQLLDALWSRWNDLRRSSGEVLEAVGGPDDTYELHDDARTPASDAALLDAIQTVLSRQSWNADTVERLAELVRESGRAVLAPEDDDNGGLPPYLNRYGRLRDRGTR